MNQEKTAEAVRLYTQGCSLDSIAVELGIHESTVRSALLRAGVRMRRRGAPGVPLSRLVALRTSGLTYDEIGRAVGLTKCSVWARLHKEVAYMTRPRTLALAEVLSSLVHALDKCRGPLAINVGCTCGDACDLLAALAQAKSILKLEGT